MKTNHKKKRYLQPEIAGVKLEKRISLVMESDPPVGPDETLQTTVDFRNQPCKQSLM